MARRRGSRSCRCAGPARGGWRWRTPPPSSAGGGSRWRSAGSPPAGAPQAGRRRAPDSSSARVPAPAPLPETSTTATSSRSPPWGRAATTKSPANGVPPADRSADWACQPSGSTGIPPWPWMRSRRSTSIDSPWEPPDSEAAAAERGQQDDEPGGEDDQQDAAGGHGDLRLPGQQHDDHDQDEDDEPRQLARSEEEAPEQHRQHERGHREVAREDEDAGGAGQGEQDQPAQVPALPREGAAHRRAPRTAPGDWAAPRVAAAAAFISVLCLSVGRCSCGSVTVRRGSGTWADIAGHQNRLRPCSSPSGSAAAHQAGLAGPAVDVDLSPVVVGPRRTPHRLGGVLGPDGVDPPRRTPSAISSTRSSHIARHCPTRSVRPGRSGWIRCRNSTSAR